MTDDKLKEIRGRYYSVGFAWAEKTSISTDMLEAMHEDVSTLLEEVERLRAEVEAAKSFGGGFYGEQVEEAVRNVYRKAVKV